MWPYLAHHGVAVVSCAAGFSPSRLRRSGLVLTTIVSASFSGRHLSASPRSSAVSMPKSDHRAPCLHVIASRSFPGSQADCIRWPPPPGQWLGLLILPAARGRVKSSLLVFSSPFPPSFPGVPSIRSPRQGFSEGRQGVVHNVVVSYHLGGAPSHHSTSVMADRDARHYEGDDWQPGAAGRILILGLTPHGKDGRLIFDRTFGLLGMYSGSLQRGGLVVSLAASITCHEIQPLWTRKSNFSGGSVVPLAGA